MDTIKTPGSGDPTAAPTLPSERVPRFDRVERTIHWTNAALFGVLFATAAILYLPSLSAAVGRRELIKAIHVYCGLALPLPVLLGLARGAFRRDLKRLARWDDDDRRWIRHDGGARLGKFNAGQKANAAFVAGAIVVMLATGAVMKWFSLFPLRFRTGATLTHDLMAFALVATVAGHIVMAIRDRHALLAMVRGWIPRSWAERKAPQWLEEIERS